MSSRFVMLPVARALRVPLRDDGPAREGAGLDHLLGPGAGHALPAVWWFVADEPTPGKETTSARFDSQQELT